jgi:hypothetical protein
MFMPDQFKRVFVRSQSRSGDLVLASLPVPFERLEAYAKEHATKCIEVVIDGRHHEVPLDDLILDPFYRHPSQVDLFATPSSTE